MTDDQKRINEIETRADAATEGPWTEDVEFGSHVMAHVDPRGQHDLMGAICCRAEDIIFTAHAREDIPWLIKLAREALKLRGIGDE